MKNIHSIFLPAILLYLLGVPTLASSQNRIGLGILSPQARLHIKGEDNISQLCIDADTIQSNLQPLIRLRKSDGTDLMWLHSDNPLNVFVGLNTGRVNTVTGTSNVFIGRDAGYSNTTGLENTAIGKDALRENSTGIRNTATGAAALRSNTTGTFNTGMGVDALVYNTTGANNAAFGARALQFNVTGNSNTAIGMEALYSNTNSDNTAVGKGTMYTNTGGGNNTAIGSIALYANTIGDNNVAVGFYAMRSNTTGDNNTAIGRYAYYTSTTAIGNTAIGYNAGKDVLNGNNNTFLGIEADANAAGYTNSTSIGSSTLVTASNQVRIGSGVSSIGGPQNWSNTSDGRIKTNIKADVPGLAFIHLLQPVTYNKSLDLEEAIIGKSADRDTSINNQYETMRYTGFIAQDVETAAQSIGYEFSGVDVPQNETSLYGLRYAEFVVPLVKAVQELQAQVEELKLQNEKMKVEMEKLNKQNKKK